VSGFLVALQFLTRLPSPTRQTPITQEFAASTRWFPLVGGLLGLIVGLIDLGLSWFTAPEIRAAIGVLLLAVLTGALHLDGLMDACDGLLAITTPERRLEIMRDSHVGSFAIVGATTLLLAKYASFLALPAEHRLAAFIAVGSLSRWAMVYAASRYPSARPDGLAFTFRTGLRTRDLAVATALAAVLAAPAGLAGGLGFVAAWLATVVLARYTESKISGLTGDTYGAICEIVEVVVAIVLPPLWRLSG
jgi:adenosylcobinamide-GDP ribazoletransferase